MKRGKAEQSPLVRAMGRVRRRLGLQKWVEYSVNALLGATIAGCVYLVLSRIFPVLWDAALIMIACWGLAFLGACVLAWRRRPDLMQAALEADDRLGLNERFTSSLALEGGSSRMVEAVHRDAAQHLAWLHLRRDFPISPSRSLRYFAIPLVLFGLGYLLLPEMDLFGFEARALEAKVKAKAIEAKARTLEHAAKLIKPPAETPESPLNEAALELEKVAASLQKEEITEKQALARVSNLANDLQKQREQMQEKYGAPQLPGDPNKLGEAKELAKDLQSGQFTQAAQKMRELKKKLESEKTSEEEKKQLAKDLQALQKMMSGEEKAMSQALADSLGELSASLESGDMTAAADALKALELSMEDMASALDQLAKLDSALGQLGEWKLATLGPSGYCRNCGKKLTPCKKGGNCTGTCKGGSCSGTCGSGSCSGSGSGLGMGGAGRGQGNQVGELQDEEVAFKPTILPGALDKGKMLANILQKAAPEGEATASMEVISGSFESVQQEAEQALTKEEIPRGSKEFVRQYFGTLDPAAEAVQSPQ